MTPSYKRFFDRDLLLALGVLPPALFLFGGHVVLGLVFMGCVVAARFSVPRTEVQWSEHPFPQRPPERYGPKPDTPRPNIDHST